MTLDPLAEMELKKLHMGTMSYGADSMDEVAHQLALAFGMTAEQGKRLSPKHIQVQCIESIGAVFTSTLSARLYGDWRTVCDPWSTRHDFESERCGHESCPVP